MRFIAIGFLCLLLSSAASAREVMTNDGRVVVVPDADRTAYRKPSPHKVVANRSPRVKVFVRHGGVIGGSDNSLIAEARRFLGATARQMGLHRVTLWCAAALEKWLRAVGLRGTGSDLALSYAHWGRPAPGPAPGVIAVFRRRGGGHVGIVTAVLGHGQIRLLSGNHGHRVREAVYSTHRVVAWRVP